MKYRLIIAVVIILISSLLAGNVGAVSVWNEVEKETQPKQYESTEKEPEPTPTPTPKPKPKQITFVNPLKRKGCTGYYYSRGYSYYHGGVDLPKRGGCWISAASWGRVVFAGWGSGGQGFYVELKHRDGFRTRYYHGSGQFVVKKGDVVRRGDRIMYMGISGYATAVHLHLELLHNGYKINPESKIDLR